MKFGEENRLITGDILYCEECNKKMIFGEETINTLLDRTKKELIVLCPSCFNKKINSEGLIKIIPGDPTKPVEFHKL